MDEIIFYSIYRKCPFILSWGFLGQSPSRMRYFDKLKNYIINLTKKGLTPHEIAVGMAVGILVAFVPVIGTHTLLALGLASLLRLSPLVVLLGTQISNPITYPFQLFICAEVGNLLLRGHFLEISFSRNINLFSHYLWPIVVGSVVLGILFAGAAYVLIKFFIKRRRRKQLQDTVI